VVWLLSACNVDSVSHTQLVDIRMTASARLA
jgi:hypothetical protein